MSYESLRSAFSARLSDLPAPLLSRILAALDAAAAPYTVTRAGTQLAAPGVVPEAVRLYIAAKAVQNLKKGSLANYCRILTAFFTRVRLPADRVTANDVRLFLYAYKRDRGVRDSTLECIRVTLHSFFEWCVDEELVRKNPVRRIPAIRAPEPNRLPLSALELEKVRRSCVTLREKALVDFLYSTAARVSELCALDLSHISFADHAVRIEHGKGDKARVTYINPESEISLKAYLAARRDDCPALFTTSRGDPRRLGVKAVQEEISRIVSRCALSVHVSPHIFRHTAASLALQRGMPVEQVQRFLGHARIQTTLRYAKVLDTDVRLSHQRCIA